MAPAATDLYGVGNPRWDWRYMRMPTLAAVIERKGGLAGSVGGSGSINGTVYLRGIRGILTMGCAGNTGWSYQDVLPYFPRPKPTKMAVTLIRAEAALNASAI